MPSLVPLAWIFLIVMSARGCVMPFVQKNPTFAESSPSTFLRVSHVWRLLTAETDDTSGGVRIVYSHEDEGQ